MSNPFRSRCAWLSLAAGMLSVTAAPPPGVAASCGEMPVDPAHVFVTDQLYAPAAPAIADAALTAEIAFAPEDDARLPPGGKKTGYGRCLFNLGSGYYSGFRIYLSEQGNGLFTPTFAVGREKGGGVSARAGAPVLAGVTNYVAVAWDGRTARFRVNGLDLPPQPLAAAWLPPKDARTLAVGNTGWGMDPVPVRVLAARVWNRALTRDELAARDLYRDAAARPSALRLMDVLGLGGAPASLPVAELDALAAQASLPAAFSNTFLRARGELLLREDRFAEAAEALRPFETADTVPSMDVFRRWADARAAERQGDWAAAAAAYAALGADASVPRHLARDARDQAVRCRARAEGRPEIGDGDLARRPVPPAPRPGACFFVSPAGDDAAAGDEACPFRSLVRARDAVRAFRRTRGGKLPPGGVCVYLRGGRHVVADTLELGPEDSGAPGAPVVWRAWKDERPVLDGGFEVPSFAPVTDPAALARIPAAAREKVLVADVSSADPDLFGPFEPYGTHFFGPKRRVHDLYRDGVPLTRARFPNAGWLRVGEATNHTFAADIDFTPWTPDREPGLVACGYWTYFWADVTLPVVSVDPVRRSFTLPSGLASFTKPRAGQTFRLENALAAVDEPGEWFLDRHARRLYVYPTAPGGRYVLASCGRTFLHAKDVSHLRIEGLVFEHGRHDALDLENVSDFVFAGNVVRCFGGDGLRLAKAVRALVAGNVFHTFGHTAMDLTSGDRRTLTSGGSAVANNVFTDTGRAQRTYSPGLHAVGVGIDVVHNHFHDIPSSAMSLGGNDHYVAWNVAERVVTESDDQGGIDMWANTGWAGIEMSFNLWKDVGGAGEDGFPAGRSGIRLDDAISGMTIYGNRFVDSSKGHFGGVQIHAGRFNFVDNNLFQGGVCGVSFSPWGREWWRKFFTRPDIRKMLHEEVEVDAEPYVSRYPHMARLLDSEMVNHVTRNAFVGLGEPLRHAPSMTDVRANRHPASASDAERLFADWSLLRPLPPRSALGLYPDEPSARAARNDVPAAAPQGVPARVEGLAAEPVAWRNVGPGGGGWIQSLCLSRWDRDLVYCGCDVGGFYVSTDGGRHWAVRNAGLDDYYVEAIAEHPVRRDTLFLGTRGGVYRTHDQGHTWKLCGKGFPKACPWAYSVQISKIVFAPDNPDTVYAAVGQPRENKGGQGQIYVSRDCGETWAQLVPAGALPAKANVFDLSVNAVDPRRLLVATDVGLFLSKDGGATWAPSNTGLPDHLRTRQLAQSPSNPTVVYVTLRQKAGDRPWRAGVYRSDDGGETWSARVAGLQQRPGDPGTSDMLSDWTDKIVVHPANPDVVYTGGATWWNPGMYRSVDGGRRWTHSSPRREGAPGWIDFWGPSVTCLSVSPAAPDTLVFGTSGMVYLSSDGARTWNDRYSEPRTDGKIAGTGLEVTCLHSVTADPTRKGRFYLGYYDIGLLVTDDAGASFTRAMKGIPGKYSNSCFSIVQAPDDPAHLWGGFGSWGGGGIGIVAESTDGGSTWTPCTAEGSGWVEAPARKLLCFGRKGAYRLLYTSKKGLVSSADGGRTWQVDPAWIFGALARDGDVLYAAKSGGEKGFSSIWRSLDQGRTWTRVTPEGLAVGGVQQIAAQGPRVLFTARQNGSSEKSGGAWLSMDGGATFRRVVDDYFCQAALIADGSLYVSLVDHPYHDRAGGGGIRVSDDDGATWHTLNSVSLHNRNVSCLCADPFDPRMLWAGTGGNSVFVGRRLAAEGGTAK